MPTRPPPRRCSEHDLVAAPDGRCTLCRQRVPGQPVVFHAPDRGSANPLQWFFGTGLGASLGLVVWLASQSNLSVSRAVEPPPLRGLPPAAAEEPAAAAAADPAKLDAPQAEAEQTGEAEATPAATSPEREDTANPDAAEPQPSARELALRTRKLEEAERDRLRHEAVARDLQKMGLAAARRNVTINMYSTDWCGVCARARSYMKQHNITFREFDIERDAVAAARAAQLNPRGSVPTIEIDDEVLIGFTPNLLESRLDRAAQRRTQP